MSYLSATEKTGISELFDTLHDTFDTTIYAFIEEPTFVDFEEEDYNPFYDQVESESQGLVVKQRYEISARVKYERWNSDDVDNDTGLPTSENIVRIKINLEDYETIKQASVIEINDDNYSLVSDDEKIGPFSLNYIQVYLRRNA